MFAKRYFPARYFATRYFPPSNAAPAVDLPALTFTLELAPRLSLTLVRVEPRILLPLPPMSILPLNTDALIRLRGVKVFDPTTGTRILATGLSIEARIAATPTGATIHASLAATLTERAAGDFHATLQGSDLETHLRTLLGTRVYLVLSVSGGDFLGHLGLQVVDGVPLGV